MAPFIPSAEETKKVLESQGQDSNFNSRKKSFVEAGLDKRLGDFVGSPAQNRALTGALIQKSTQVATEAARVAGLPEFQPGATVSPTGEVTPTAAGIEALAARPEPAKPSEVAQPPQAQPPQRFGLTEIPTPPVISAADILARARGETKTQIAEQEAKIGKERLRAELPGELASIRGEFASRGLVFSGARTTAEKQVRDESLQAELDIDIRFAKILGNAIDRAQTELGKEIEDIIKDAKAQRKEEVDFLKSVGLAVNPVTGELFPTLEAERLINAQEAADFSKELSLAKLSNEIERIDIAKANLAIAFQKEARLASDDVENPGGYSDQELRKIREAKIDSTNIEEADDFLYGSGAKRVLLTPDQTSLIAGTLFELIGETKGFEDIDEAKVFVNTQGIVEVNGEKIKLSDTQKAAIDAELDFLQQKKTGARFVPFI